MSDYWSGYTAEAIAERPTYEVSGADHLPHLEGFGLDSNVLWTEAEAFTRSGVQEALSQYPHVNATMYDDQHNELAYLDNDVAGEGFHIDWLRCGSQE